MKVELTPELEQALRSLVFLTVHTPGARQEALDAAAALGQWLAQEVPQWQMPVEIHTEPIPISSYTKPATLSSRHKKREIALRRWREDFSANPQKPGYWWKRYQRRSWVVDASGKVVLDTDRGD